MVWCHPDKKIGWACGGLWPLLPVWHACSIECHTFFHREITRHRLPNPVRGGYPDWWARGHRDKQKGRSHSQNVIDDQSGDPFLDEQSLLFPRLHHPRSATRIETRDRKPTPIDSATRCTHEAVTPAHLHQVGRVNSYCS